MLYDIYIKQKKQKKKQKKQIGFVEYFFPDETLTLEREHDKPTKNDLCAQRKLRSAWASAQSD